jgi:hypothetical protein
MIATVRRVGALARDVAPAIADELRAFIASEIAAGRTPGGDTLRPRKADGGQPLQNAAKAITVRAVGTIITAEVTGFPELLHNVGHARGAKEPRRLVPAGGVVPSALADRVRALLSQRFAEATR